MTRESVVTRFAPSPTGQMHLGNARTARFNLLLARGAGEVLPDDVLPWVALLEAEQPVLSAEAAAAVAAADRRLFAAAAANADGNDFQRITAAARAATGLKGAALTGRLDGPELATFLKAVPEGLSARRLARFA